MDAREREVSQSYRSSIKRPWEDTALPENGNVWHSALLPTADTMPYRRELLQREVEIGAVGTSWYGPDSKEPVMKKAKFEGHDYNTFPRQNLNQNGKTPPTRNPHIIYDQNRGSLSRESPTFPPKPSAPTAHGPADSQDASNLCPRCRRMTIKNRASDSVSDPDSCEDCKNPELAWVTEESATWLTHLAETLRSGLSSEQRGIFRGPEHHRIGSTGCPPIAEFGLKQTLNWVLSRIHHVNQLADQLVRQVPAGILQNLNTDFNRNGTKVQDGPADIMKRRVDVDSDDAFNSRDDVDSSSDAKPHTRRRSMTTSMLANEELPPLRSQPDYHQSLPSIEEGPQRVSGMNPPPAPNRQLPSPPGRSFPSPTSNSFPSPSPPSYGINSQGVNLPPPSTLHQSANSNYLPPITAAHSSDSALRDHTAALQHEVSVQKIALSSLQGEHDKLLAAFSRSQTRASALEKKHAVSDGEIISLTEEKLRLQAQVIELERDVEELARSRDESRQAAVQEGMQYIEIVKKATRLEEIAGEERRHWNKLKEEMERKIETLSAGSSTGQDGSTAAEEILPVPRQVDQDTGTNTPASSVEFLPALKLEPTSEPRSTAATSYQLHLEQESAEDLRAEIRRLRERCIEVENALRAIRDDSHSMEGIARSLVERADSTLQM